ncbi:2-amino-4-hydroxy-6-hydroxymethyldihydropteridine diphosphokinase [Paramicrobacterium agarici]|uniref:2-amino-4-hydroxy-6-hydroxymethyldihydropteridine diphosphokinase n=1 Tax=Paramicrobacterium agarici TaxID=630514 RepID=A0A2A9DV50_9MICO|nr:2-amino-4-hydroxy-6-hydroxymethyldihydropteridine diphosphokinase [Microbacterium agarici]PFG30473.1 2-amino-4-hydroxy-6-hydroxymethyldihydropteridine diphosphokinase/dihydroneopterin aldolase/2-amino-4-hydroxy-6-hydroxymethyldihydropteridine diphosphokinase [Microbacterium agarici]
MIVRDPTRPLRSTNVVLALGANLGDRRATLEAAVDDLRVTPGVIVDAVSTLIESVAVTLDGADESAPAYLNGVVLARTVLGPRELLAATSRIEDAHGRIRAERWGSRTLDIDIITFGELRQSDPQLTLPHPRAAERPFVLDPWLELDPDAVLPGLGSVAALRRERASDE